ncbi:MAG TPA: hypothetical protein VM425_15015 [Myxococcota bacterium]|nr:hypothetical protein [Myxococcota bacterium]
MSDKDQDISGLTPQQWERRLEQAAGDPEELGRVLQKLEAEMRGENTWLHENPTPGKVLSLVLRFIGGDDDDLRRLDRKLDTELSAEREMKRRYRGWLPGESAQDRLFSYVKDFAGEIGPCSDGLQFEGFVKYKGVSAHGSLREVFAFYLNQRFPGRDPANFQLSFDSRTCVLVIRRVYKMELPRPPRGPSAARAVLAELVTNVCDSVGQVESLVVDNAANIETRKALMRVRHGADGVTYEPIPGAEVEKTPLGHLMLRLANELDLKPGGFSIRVMPFGVLEIVLPVRP